MAQQTTPVRLTASGQVLAGAGVVCDMIVSDITTALSVKLYDYLSGTSTVLLNTMTFPAVGYYNLGNKECTIGCYATLVGTGSITFGVKSRD